MDSETEFPMPNAEAVSYYFQVEHHFVPAKNFYSDPTNLRIRKLAVSSIAKHYTQYWTDGDMDAFVPYLAMNYFDRFASRNPYLVLDVSLTAICCLTIAAKKRTKSFSLTSFMEGRFVDIKVEILMKIEHLILSALDDIKPVTPFCFLDHFYPQFKSIGGFKRHCINEIIVQAQGEDKFMEYKPSEIALASFLAATHIAYPSRIIASIPIPEGLTNCYRGLVDLCHNKGIKIVRAKLETPSPSSANETETETETESDKQGQATGKEEDTKLHVSTSETIES